MAIQQQLRPYQIEVGRAVLESVLNRRGLTFSVEIARQGGKNELSAQLEVLLLTLFAGFGGNLVKCAPTFKPQVITSMARLKERLNDAGYSGVWVPEHGYMVRFGKACQIFLSAEGSSSVVGATAHILLEVDESQDVSPEKYSKEFKPMASTTNATTVHYGTAWDDKTLLEQVKQTNLELERRDGIKRHFQYDWQEIAKYNPDYGRYVDGERQRLGESHPLFQTQYCLRPIHGGGGFLSQQQLAQMRGDHPRRHRPDLGRSVFVAGVDVGGEESEEVALRAAKPRQDSTVLTIARLDYADSDDIIGSPRLEIVEHYWWIGVSHNDLYARLVDVLKNVWRCKRVVVDSTGLGEGIASFLRKALGRSVVIPFKFSQSSKSSLGFELLAAINGGRVKIYAADGSEEYGQFWFQMERAKSSYRANQTMNFFVDPSEGHDDFLMSLALAVEAAKDYVPRKAKGGLRKDLVQ